MSEKTVQLHSLAENKYVLAGSNKKQFYLYVELKATEVDTPDKRLPLNISLVIDKSGSMKGSKLNYSKKALSFVVDNLNTDDYLSIVEYDSQVKTISPSAKVSNKGILQQKINRIQAGNTTNLSGGMLEGYQQVSSTKKEGFVNRVLLLSDGLANRGITAPEKLQNIAQQRFRENGIGLSTFGVGADFNELLMTGLAEYGGANYYFIDNADKIPTIFAEELEGLLAVVAQNTKVKIDFSNQYLSCKKVYGFPADISTNSVEVSFNDVFSKEEKAILIEFEVTNEIDSDLNFGITATYDDALSLGKRIKESQQVLVEMTSDSNLQQNNVHSKTAENIALFLSTDLFETAIKAEEKGDISKAKTLCLEAKAQLEAHFKLYAAPPALSELLKQINAYYQKLDTIREMSQNDYKMMKKRSRSSSYLARNKRL